MEERQLEARYRRIVESQTARWQGKQVPIGQLASEQSSPDRKTRERAWRAEVAGRLAGQAAIDQIWRRLIEVRAELARQAGFQATRNADVFGYREYRWRQLGRIDCTPEDCVRLHLTIEEWASSAAIRLHEERRQKLGLRTLRPWDLRSMAPSDTSQNDAPEIRLLTWIRAAMLDAFEHWIYGDPERTADPRSWDGEWARLWLRFMPSVDWDGLDDGIAADWRAQSALFLQPCESITAIAFALDEHALREAVAAIEGAHDPGK